MHKIELPLDIPDVKIEKVKITEDAITITVQSTVNGTTCRKCGKGTPKYHGCDREISLRHLPILGKKTYIRIRPLRYICTDCDDDPTTTQKLSWYNPRSPHTKAYEKYILFSAINSTVEDVSHKEDIGYEAVMGIINRHIGEVVNWNQINMLEIIGIDEISLKKGHQDFVTIVTGRIGTKTMILGVLKDRKKMTVKRFLKGIPKHLKKTVVAVCSDMYEGFINAAKEIFGKRIIVIDRFHVAKLYHKSFESLRKTELARLKKELSEIEYKKLKGAMWALRKREENVTEEELEVIERLFIYSPLLKAAYMFCNELTDLFDEDISKSKAKKEITKWKERIKQSGLACFDKFISTLDKSIDEITNYFHNRHTSGFVEGLNNKIKVIKRRCYGIINIKHLYQRIFLDLEGYGMFAGF